jgi:hypothetical protein
MTMRRSGISGSGGRPASTPARCWRATRRGGRQFSNHPAGGASADRHRGAAARVGTRAPGRVRDRPRTAPEKVSSPADSAAPYWMPPRLPTRVPRSM